MPDCHHNEWMEKTNSQTDWKRSSANEHTIFTRWHLNKQFPWIRFEFAFASLLYQFEWFEGESISNNRASGAITLLVLLLLLDSYVLSRHLFQPRREYILEQRCNKTHYTHTFFSFKNKLCHFGIQAWLYICMRESKDISCHCWQFIFGRKPGTRVFLVLKVDDDHSDYKIIGPTSRQSNCEVRKYFAPISFLNGKKSGMETFECDGMDRWHPGEFLF